MTTSTTRAGRLLAAGFALTLLLVACSDDSDDGAQTTTTAPSGQDEGTTTTSGDEGPTDDELEALLPTAADVGEGWTEVPADPEDGGEDELTKQLDEDCPAMADIRDDEEDNPKRSFEDEGFRTLDVEIGLRSDGDPTAAELVEAADGCEIDAELNLGLTVTGSLSAEEVDLGDEGAHLTMEMTMSHPDIPQPIQLTGHFLAVREGEVWVTANVVDGIDESTLEVAASDPALVSSLVGDIVEELAG